MGFFYYGKTRPKIHSPKMNKFYLILHETIIKGYICSLRLQAERIKSNHLIRN